MAHRDRLRALEVRVAGHHPRGVVSSLHGKRVHGPGNSLDQRASRRAGVQPEVERDLVVPRPARVQGGTGRSDLSQPPLDSGVDVLVRLGEGEPALAHLFADGAKAPLNGLQLRGRQQAGGREPARMRDAPGDVIREQLEVHV